MIRLDRQGDVAVVTLDRPAAKNAVDRATMKALHALIDEIESDASLGCAILTAAGDTFIAGGDLRDLAALTTAAEGRAMSLAMQATLARWAALPFPTIAAINGDAFGGGCEIALACDLRVIATGARMVWKQVAMGLGPGWGGGQRLQRLVGPSRALRWLVTSAAVGAEEALASGLVDRVDDRALAAAHELAAVICSSSRAAVRAVKRALVVGRDLPLGAAIDFEAELFGQLWGQGDHRAAVSAFLTRR